MQPGVSWCVDNPNRFLKTRIIGNCQQPIKDKKRITFMSFTKQILLGLIFGIFTGIFLGELAKPFSVGGDIYIGLLQMTVLPYIVLSLIRNIGGISWSKRRYLIIAAIAVLAFLLLLGVAVLAAVPMAFPAWQSASFFSTGLLPHWFAVTHPVHHTPGNAILLVGAVSLVGPFVGKFALKPIVNSSSFIFTSALAVTSAAAIRLRKSAPALKRPYRAPTPFLYMGAVISVVLLLLMILPQSPGQVSVV
jgi:amino acid transporter